MELRVNFSKNRTSFTILSFFPFFCGIYKVAVQTNVTKSNE